MSRCDNCPHCNVSFLGELIPEDEREAFGGVTHFRRDFMIEVQGSHDGALIMQCPDCKVMWPRFADGPLHALATMYIERWKSAAGAA